MRLKVSGGALLIAQLCALTGCFFTEVDESVFVQCHTGECPTGYECVDELEYCLPISRADDTVPELVAVTVAPTVVSSSTEAVTLTVEANEPLFITPDDDFGIDFPIVKAVIDDETTVDALVTDRLDQGAKLQLGLLGNEPDGTYTISIRLADKAGNIATYEEDVLVIDRTGPRLTAVSFSPSAVAPGGDLEVRSRFDQALTGLPRLDFVHLSVASRAICDDEAAFSISATIAEDDEYVAQAAVPVDASGAYIVRAHAFDAVGNEGCSVNPDITGAHLVVDDEPPVLMLQDADSLSKIARGNFLVDLWSSEPIVAAEEVSVYACAFEQDSECVDVDDTIDFDIADADGLVFRAVIGSEPIERTVVIYAEGGRDAAGNEALPIRLGAVDVDNVGPQIDVEVLVDDEWTPMGESITMGFDEQLSIRLLAADANTPSCELSIGERSVDSDDGETFTFTADDLFDEDAAPPGAVTSFAVSGRCVDAPENSSFVDPGKLVVDRRGPTLSNFYVDDSRLGVGETLLIGFNVDEPVVVDLVFEFSPAIGNVVSSATSIDGLALTWSTLADDLPEGEHTILSVTTTDLYGNSTTTNRADLLVVDRTAPVFSLAGELPTVTRFAFEVDIDVVDGSDALSDPSDVEIIGCSDVETGDDGLACAAGASQFAFDIVDPTTIVHRFVFPDDEQIEMNVSVLARNGEDLAGNAMAAAVLGQVFIDNRDPRVTLLSSNGNTDEENFRIDVGPNDNVALTLDVEDASSDVDGISAPQCDLSVGDIAIASEDDGSFIVDIAELLAVTATNGDAAFQIDYACIDAAGNATVVSPGAVRVDGTPPTLSWNPPDALFAAHDVVEFSVESSEDLLEPPIVILDPTLANVDDYAETTGRVTSWSIPVERFAEGEHDIVSVTASDLSGNENIIALGSSFVIDTQPPELTLTVTTPYDENIAGADTDSDIDAGVSDPEDIDGGSQADGGATEAESFSRRHVLSHEDDFAVANIQVIATDADIQLSVGDVDVANSDRCQTEELDDGYEMTCSVDARDTLTFGDDGLYPVVANVTDASSRTVSAGDVILLDTQAPDGEISALFAANNRGNLDPFSGGPILAIISLTGAQNETTQLTTQLRCAVDDEEVIVAGNIAGGLANCFGEEVSGESFLSSGEDSLCGTFALTTQTPGFENLSADASCVAELFLSDDVDNSRKSIADATIVLDFTPPAAPTALAAELEFVFSSLSPHENVIDGYMRWRESFGVPDDEFSAMSELIVEDDIAYVLAVSLDKMSDVAQPASYYTDQDNELYMSRRNFDENASPSGLDGWMPLQEDGRPMFAGIVLIDEAGWASAGAPVDRVVQQVDDNGAMTVSTSTAAGPVWADRAEWQQTDLSWQLSRGYSGVALVSEPQLRKVVRGDDAYYGGGRAVYDPSSGDVTVLHGYALPNYDATDSNATNIAAHFNFTLGSRLPSGSGLAFDYARRRFLTISGGEHEGVLTAKLDTDSELVDDSYDGDVPLVDATAAFDDAANMLLRYGGFLDVERSDQRCVSEHIDSMNYRLLPAVDDEDDDCHRPILVRDSRRGEITRFDFPDSGDVVTYSWGGPDGWELIDVDTAPPSRGWPTVFYDDNADRFVLMGGATTTSFTSGAELLDDIWWFDGEEWSEQAMKLPEPVAGAAAAYSHALGLAVLVGGWIDNDAGGIATRPDTWNYTPDEGFSIRTDVSYTVPWAPGSRHTEAGLVDGRTALVGPDGLLTASDGDVFVDTSTVDWPTDGRLGIDFARTDDDRWIGFGGADGNWVYDDTYVYADGAWTRFDGQNSALTAQGLTRGETDSGTITFATGPGVDVTAQILEPAPIANPQVFWTGSDIMLLHPGSGTYRFDDDGTGNWTQLRDATDSPLTVNNRCVTAPAFGEAVCIGVSPVDIDVFDPVWALDFPAGWSSVAPTLTDKTAAQRDTIPYRFFSVDLIAYIDALEGVLAVLTQDGVDSSVEGTEIWWFTPDEAHLIASIEPLTRLYADTVVLFDEATMTLSWQALEIRDGQSIPPPDYVLSLSSVRPGVQVQHDHQLLAIADEIKIGLIGSDGLGVSDDVFTISAFDGDRLTELEQGTGDGVHTWTTVVDAPDQGWLQLGGGSQIFAQALWFRVDVDDGSTLDSDAELNLEKFTVELAWIRREDDGQPQEP